jgi:pimeloyl-ACP methyl ester carboxylesterase
VLLGEHDVMFIKPSELLVRCIPRVREVVLDGLGHMTAIEDPERTGDELLSFLASVS